MNFDKISVFWQRLLKVLSFGKIIKSSKYYAWYWNLTIVDMPKVLNDFCKPCYWNKEHASINPLMLMTDWLMAMECSQKATIHFLSVFTDVAKKTSFLRCIWGAILKKSATFRFDKSVKNVKTHGPKTGKKPF